MQNGFHHLAVLANEVSAFLAPEPGHVLVDATIGGGGHAAMLAAKMVPGGVLIGIDRDLTAIEAARQRLQGTAVTVILVHGNFIEIAGILRHYEIGKVDGILFDLGVSSPQLDEAARGFSYNEEAPLDMRMDARQFLTARHLVNETPEDELARIIAMYGEERWARRIAGFIARERRRKPLETTAELAALVKAAIPARARRRGPHPARRTFQALRIAVNDELNALRRGLADAIELLKPGGRIVVISFHSLEDRLVKEEFARRARSCLCPPEAPVCQCGGPQIKLLTRKPVTASAAERAANPRARSAKLRAAVKLV